MTNAPSRPPIDETRPPRLSERVGMLIADLRYAARALVRRPTFSLVVVGTLALGIGANIAVFTIVRNVVLRPPPYPEPNGLVALWMEFRRDPAQAGFEIVASEPEYVEFRDATTSFAGIAGFWTQQVNLLGNEEPIRVRAASVSANLLNVLGVMPVLGRGFRPGEDAPGAPAVAVLSDGLWARAFGRDSGLVGRTITANGQSYEVIGVMPPGFRVPGAEVDFLSLNTIDPANLAGRSSHYLRLIGRLKSGVSLEAAESEAAVAVAQLEEAQPGMHGVSRTHPMRLASLQARRSGPHRPALWLLSSAACLVLLIACANVANLMYVRSESRGRELAIRGALGAARGRLMGHLLMESLLLSTVGAALALGLTTLLLPRLQAAGGGGLLPSEAWRMDWVVVAFALGMGVLSAVAFGSAPTLGASRTSGVALRDGRGWGDPRRTRIRNGLLLTQLGVAVVLLIGAGVLTRNLLALMHVDPGFNSDGVVAMTFFLDESRYPDTDALAEFHRRLDQRLVQLPVVAASGAVRTLPLVSDGGQETLTASGVRADSDDDGINAVYQVASPGYFRALSIPLVSGRLFDATDTRSAPLVVVINETMAARYWPDGDAIGNTILMGPPRADNPNPVMRIVGVVGDVIQGELGRRPSPQFFVPRTQARAYRGLGTREATLVVKGTGTPSSLIATVRSAIRDLDPRIPVADVRTMEAVVEESITSERFLSLLMAIFAAVALGLAAIGVYGLMAYIVAQRTRDIGLRMALGADRGRVIGEVVGRSVGLASLGAILGVAGAVAGSRLLERFVVLVSVRDPLIFAIGPVVLVVTAALAAYAPARRAASVDPTQALRAE